jgi:Tfp pilus assembly protein FimV
VVAGLAVMAASATAVIAVGLLAQIAGQSVEPAADAPRAPASSILVTAQPGETVWEVAVRVAPGRSGPEVAALAERIAVENALSSARLGAGQVLRVPAG